MNLRWEKACIIAAGCLIAVILCLSTAVKMKKTDENRSVFRNQERGNGNGEETAKKESDPAEGYGENQPDVFVGIGSTGAAWNVKVVLL